MRMSSGLKAISGGGSASLGFHSVKNKLLMQLFCLTVYSLSIS